MYGNNYLTGQFSNRYMQPNEQSIYNMQPIQPVQMQQYQQQLPQNNTICGKLVESVDVARTIETPMNGSKIYLPLLDESKIVVKQLQNDGRTKTIIYEIAKEPIASKEENINYVTKHDLNAYFKENYEDKINDVVEEVSALKKEIKVIKKEK